MMKMIEKEKNIRIPKTVIGVAFIAVIAVIAVVVATIGTVYSVAISVCSILLIVVISIAVIWWETKKNVQGVLESQRIEAEKQAIEMKLQESQIAIMLSQIQPHFLYNTLNSIYQLCETNPMRARSMVNFFAEYLRNNLSTLEEPGLISFETELSHIKTYLEIEKIRFEDTLEIEYDIKCADFSLPVLTVQPIVENAVKHGTSKKRGGGAVTISTDEDNESYIIKVTDTGCGFDPNQPKDDGKRHIGIENVKQRLSNMCAGSLTIESEVGVGTLATIRIPKGSTK
jgi:sensor histidine kinase YesM